MDLNKIGSLISALRKEKGLTQKELGDKLGITDRAVSKWERGLGCPDVSLLDDLSRELDVSILEILKGRLLDKDELASNEVLIESMNYSKESFKNRLKKRFNKISIILVALICLFFCFVNIKSFYYLNKTYKVAGDDYYDSFQIDKLKSDIELIKNNQGIFSDEDYSLILEYLDYENVLKDVEDNLNKKTYSYSELNSIYFDLYNYYRVSSKSEDVYKLLVKYDYSIIDNLDYYYSYTDTYNKVLDNFKDFLDSPFHIKSDTDSRYAESISHAIVYKILLVKSLIKDIIETGDINE